MRSASPRRSVGRGPLYGLRHFLGTPPRDSGPISSPSLRSGLRGRASAGAPASVGANVPRKEGPEKLCGLAKYIDDYEFPGGLFGATLRSTVPHARVKALRFDPGFPWHEFVVATAKDIPGANVVTLIEKDQPLLADGRVMHPMEPIALVAHPERARAYEALGRITVEYEELPAVLSIDESLAVKQRLFGEDNVFKKFLIEKGDPDGAMLEAEFVVEGEYRVPHQEQAYIENNGVAARFEPDGTLVVMGSLQCPYYVHKALKPIFALPDEKVRVVQTTTGGGFGGKEEYPNMLAGHAALLAWKAKRPVKMVYDRAEDMAATTKRHPARIRVRSGLRRDGKLAALDIDVVMDGGAYATLSSVVLSRGTLHATGPYECPNVRVRSRTVATNTPPNGAFRGFGAPQTLFAAELHWERVSKVLGIDAVTLRRRNLFKTGSVTATGQTLRESVGASAVLETVLERSGYAKKRREFDRWNKKKDASTWKGIGLAVVHHGAGFTGSGETYLASEASVSLTKEGSVRVEAASTEIGQGTNSMFAQLAAEALGLPYEAVVVEAPDTAKVPDSGPTVASRTCMVVGGLVQRAALELKAAVASSNGGSFPKSREGLRAAAKRLCDGRPERRFLAKYETPKEIVWDDATYKGDAYGVYSYAALAVEVEVDRQTYELRLGKVTTAQDIGRAIHPLFAEGQIIGGTAQGLGYAALENAVYKNGAMLNAQFTNYVIPTALDTPAMDVTIVEKPYSRGPFGAKGVGELPMDVPGPAVAAAVRHATGKLIAELPILPERIFEALSPSPARRMAGEGRG